MVCSFFVLLTRKMCIRDRGYAAYVDLRVLCLLFCLMLVVAGTEDCGVFAVLAQRLLAGRKRFRLLALILVLLPFFSSLLITNDVSLIPFVDVYKRQISGRPTLTSRRSAPAPVCCRAWSRM